MLPLCLSESGIAKELRQQGFHYGKGKVIRGKRGKTGLAQAVFAEMQMTEAGLAGSTGCALLHADTRDRLGSAHPWLVCNKMLITLT